MSLQLQRCIIPFVRILVTGPTQLCKASLPVPITCAPSTAPQSHLRDAGGFCWSQRSSEPGHLAALGCICPALLGPCCPVLASQALAAHCRAPTAVSPVPDLHVSLCWGDEPCDLLQSQQCRVQALGHCSSCEGALPHCTLLSSQHGVKESTAPEERSAGSMPEDARHYSRRGEERLLRVRYRT